MKNIFARLGPGMMVAAVGVGVSHLVQSTRAGAEFGLSLVLLITVIVLLKYPAFRFGVDYACATGRSLVTGYAKISKVALAWLGAAFIVDTFIAPAAVSLVTAGLVISIFDLDVSAPRVAVGLTILTAIVLLNGHYAKAEKIVKVLVIAFSALTLVATLFALPLLGSDNRPVFAVLQPDLSMLIFVIAVTGWMPMPLSGAIFHSLWICERQRGGDTGFDRVKALFDLKVGYGLTLVLAICFVIMGTAVLFETDRVAPASPGAFAAELLSIFTTVFGNWMYPIIAIAALAVMWSTLVALMDAAPRVVDRLCSLAANRPDNAEKRYTLFLAIQVIGVTAILLFLIGGFVAFIDFATSMGFLAAPAIAYYNYRAITSPDIPEEYRPNTKLVAWSWISVVSLTAFALSYFVMRVI
ncbi:MAG: Mn2+/Fe2+ NRAMP family transporter [Woeseiaceae bacterium]